MSLTISLDTSTALTGAGIWSEDGLQAEAFDVPEIGARPRHAGASILLLEGLLSGAGATWADVSRVVVGLGPGSFTGLRVGVATAMGLASGSDAELVGASSLKALLMGGGTEGPVCAMIDARRGELYIADSSDPSAELCVPCTLEGVALAPGALCLGDGAVLESDRLLALGLSVPPADANLHRVSPLRLIEVVNSGGGIQSVLPSYVRDADAIPTAERRG